MAYRADLEALKARLASIEREMAEAKARSRELEALGRSDAQLARDLAETQQQIAALGNGEAPRALLDSVAVAAPCNAPWESMTGDDKVRFCGECAKNVYNLSALTRAEAEELVRSKEGNLCTRYFRRFDGTILTADCPVGQKRRRRRLIVVGVGAGAIAGGLVAAAFIAGGKDSTNCDLDHEHYSVQGSAAIPSPPRSLPP